VSSREIPGGGEANEPHRVSPRAAVHATPASRRIAFSPCALSVCPRRCGSASSSKVEVAPPLVPSTAATVRLTGARTHDFLSARAVVVKVTVEGDATLSATGSITIGGKAFAGARLKLKPAKGQAVAGRSTTLKLKLTARGRPQAPRRRSRQAPRHGERLRPRDADHRFADNDEDIDSPKG
jgi:hypothetical protein